MTDQDSLTIKPFDSKPGASILDKFISDPAKKKREAFAKSQCPIILPKDPRPEVLPGTDIRQIWLKFHEEYKERRNNDSSKDSKAKNIEDPSEVFILYVDSLERMFDGQGDSNEELRNKFRSSLQGFINDKNYALFVIANSKDRERLGYDVDSIKNQEKRLVVIDSSGDFKSLIEQLYSRAKAEKK